MRDVMLEWEEPDDTITITSGESENNSKNVLWHFRVTHEHLSPVFSCLWVDSQLQLFPVSSLQAEQQEQRASTCSRL
ncbi:hypothetical protein AV530_008541 [Patagioenas fasciata monilis]|uniref:Uncharacterized protein n=1 Tax=Patagioenas fasciata monilis TaxID=372326 RepID=A0A1V4KEH2_PATFA|nr:hypothetical protein AV530_008541 [Patagioenas fasciata monilis]